MNHIKNTLGAIVTIGLTAIATQVSAAQSIVDKVTGFEWTASNYNRLQALLTSSSVTDLVNRQLGSAEVPATVGEFRLVDLNNEGKLELVCTADFSGRGFFTTVAVLSMRNGKVTASQVSTNGASMEGLDSHLVDLNHEGKQELLIPRLIDQYAGAKPVAMFTDVYKWQDGALVQSDKQFRNYYQEQRLPAVTAKIQDARAALTQNPVNARAAAEVEALTKEAEAIKQLIAQE